jgi:hypothetical protein
MKNTVEHVIKSFTKDEYREFKYFIARQQNVKTDREDLKTIKIIRDDAIHTISNKKAFSLTKNRIKKHLELFVSLENLKYDHSSRVQNKLEVAKYLFKKGLYNEGWDYLKKAETMAGNESNYELLNEIYNIQLRYSYNIAMMPLDSTFVKEILKKRDLNVSLAKLHSDANAAYAKLNNDLRDKFSVSLQVNINELVKDIFNQYKLTDTSIQQNKVIIYHKLVQIGCRELREKKEYGLLKEHAINAYKTFIKQGLNEQIYAEYLIGIVDDVCKSSLRSMDYLNFDKYRAIYRDLNLNFKSNKSEFSYRDFVVKIDESDSLIFNNKLPAARKVLLKLYQDYQNRSCSPRIYFLIRLNLIAMHFMYGEYKACIKMYNEIVNYGEKHFLNGQDLRVECILLTHIYACIFHYERGDEEYAAHLMMNLKRKYRELLKSNDSKWEQSFIAILENVFNNPAYIKSKEFKKDYTAFKAIRHYVPGDDEYICAEAWLASKLTLKTYYECFLETSHQL